MPKEMIINAFVPDNVRVAILEENRLNAFFEEFAQDYRSRSNIYLGRVIHIEPSLDACFVDFGAERHGFLPFSEISPPYWQKKSPSKTSKRAEGKVKRGQLLVVQVDKEASGSKGAKLTTYLSLAGRYMVLMPYSDTRGVSRKIDDPESRKSRKEIIDTLKVPKDMGLIIRTAGESKNKRDLTRDLNYLIRLWKDIQKKARGSTNPVLIHAEADLIQRILRDYYTSDMERIWIDDRVALSKAENFFKLFMPRQKHKVHFFSEKLPIFSHFKIENQIEEIHSRRVSLPSGGSLVIDPTEALVSIDVNSGRMKSKNQETTAFDTNIEAAKEVARQLALRDLGGIVVIDFIDMSSMSHRTAVERTLRDEFRRGKARTKVSKISAFGLCTLTRQRLGRSISTLGQRECPTCMGSGLVPDLDVVSMRLLRKLRAEAASGKFRSVQVKLNFEFANHFQNRFRADISAIECELDMEIFIEASSSANPQGFDILYNQRPEPKADSKRPTAVQKPAPSADSSKPKKMNHSKRAPDAEKKPDTEESSKTEQDVKKSSKPSSSSKKRPRKRNWRNKKKSAASEAKKGSVETPVSDGERQGPESKTPQKESGSMSGGNAAASDKTKASEKTAEKKLSERPQKKRRRWRKPKPSTSKKAGEAEKSGSKELLPNKPEKKPASDKK